MLEAPIARAVDPETSHLAARQVDRQQLMRHFVAAVAGLGKCTAAEVRQFYVDAGLTIDRAESIRKRASEAAKAGQVRICGRRRCQVTNNFATVYEVTQ
jgi:hypothetical protein